MTSKITVATRDLAFHEFDIQLAIPPTVREKRSGPWRDPLVERQVLISAGPFKGYRGIIKNVNRG
jgi:transcription elongation factor